jgi:hypothetical protein
MKFAIMTVLSIFIVAAGGMAGASAAASGSSALTLDASDFRIVEAGGAQKIVVEGYGHLMTPGRPCLPVKRYLILLPPGARARRVEVTGARTEELPGTYRIEPFPGILPLPDHPRLAEEIENLRSEWETNYNQAYLSDRPYPADIAWLAGSGTLRKYSYASVAFCPFTYHPESGRLVYHSEADISVEYSLPQEGSAESASLHRLLADRAADGRAATLFVNYKEMAALYSTEADQSAPLEGPYELVIITTADLAGAVSASGFPSWKTALGYNLRTVLTTDAEITGQPGADLAEQIRNFLRSYYGTWGIEYVLLVGDYATVPMRICYPDPNNHVYNPDDPGLAAPGTPTDYYYADLSYADDVSWDLDGDGYPGEYGQDSPDFLAEVSVGRIPVNDTDRITYALDKIVAFEQDTGAWKSNALHAGAILFFENQDHSGYPFVDGADCIDSIGVGLMSGWSITRMSEQMGLVTSLFPWPQISETAFGDAWRTGQHAVVNWSGHGWCDGAYRTVWEWDDGDGVPETGNGEMRSYRFVGTGTSDLDDDHPSIVFAISCNVGYPDPNPYGNLGIDLLTLPGWGAAAGIVSSSRPASVSGNWRQYPGGTEQICYEFNRHMIAMAEKVGDALYDGKYYATTNYGWDHVYEYMNLYNFNLFGDPSLELAGASAHVGPAGGRERSGAPVFLSSEPNPFRTSTSLRLVLPAAGRVCIAAYDITGRRVAVIAEGRFDAGESVIAWDGTGDDGRELGPGLYLVAAEGPEGTAYEKTVLLR